MTCVKILDGRKPIAFFRALCYALVDRQVSKKDGCALRLDGKKCSPDPAKRNRNRG
jgi:hypothetical protein